MNAFFNAKISDSTRNLYRRNLIRLNGEKEFKSLNFLKKHKDILAKIKDLPLNTQKSYVIAIVSALKHMKDEKLLAVYQPLMMGLNKKANENNEKSESQQENWLSHEEVMDVQRHLSKVLPKTFHRPADYDKLLDLMVLSLYTLIPPRRSQDYIKMLTSKPATDADKSNYIEDGKFVFNVYKTARTYGRQSETIPPELQKILDIYMSEHSDTPELLVKKNGVPMKLSSEITHRLNKIFGRKLSTSMLRNIYLTSKYSNVMNEMKNDATAMGTSTNVAQHNYIKTE
jgi:hypothetical protein